MKEPTPKSKISKSTKYYLLCGGASVIIIFLLLLLYAYLAHINILAWFKSKYAFIMYGAILIYATVGLILIIRDRIGKL